MVSRLSGMSMSEVYSRATQEVLKRMDYAAYCANLAHRPLRDCKQTTVNEGIFFFSEDEAPTLCKMLRETLPSDVASLIREADSICRHQFNLLGYHDLDYG